MADYISREAAIDAVDVGNLHRGIVNALQEIISDIPAADVVEVVRCKDCIYYTSSDVDAGAFRDCISGMGLVQPDEYDFCPYGERREPND